MNKIFEEESWNYRVIVIPIMLFFTVFLLWAGFFKVDEVVRGEGKVVPSGQTKVLQHLEGGIIEEIFVREGDKVEKGDVIYSLANAYFNADLKSKEIELLSYQASATRIKAEIDGLTELTFPKDITEQIPDIAQNERELFETNLESNMKKINIAQDQLNQQELKLKELQVRYENLSLELNVAQENMKIQEQLVNRKVISRKEYLGELAKKQQIVTQLEEVRNNLPVAKAEILEAQKKVANIESEIKSKALKQYSEVKVEINKLLESNKANIDREIRRDVVSPVKGIVNKLYFYTVGGIVKAGDKIAEITPIDDNLMIEAKIKTADRALIWPGQKVSIEITAYDFSKYGLLEGELISVSPDSFIENNGFTYYVVKIKSDKSEFAPELPILPGMVANVNILTGKKTILEYILKPLKDISNNSLKEK